MYTFEPPICIPKTPAEGRSPVSTRRAFAVRWRPNARHHWVFVVVALPPPPVTSPATRLCVFRRERLSSLQDDHFLSASSVFIRMTRTSVSADPQLSLSASAPGVQDSGFPLLLSANGVSPPPFHLPVSVKIPVSDLDCDVIIYPKFSKSSRIYFNY